LPSDPEPVLSTIIYYKSKTKLFAQVGSKILSNWKSRWVL